jgi:hypothetical protein
MKKRRRRRRRGRITIVKVIWISLECFAVDINKHEERLVGVV